MIEDESTACVDHKVVTKKHSILNVACDCKDNVRMNTGRKKETTSRVDRFDVNNST